MPKAIESFINEIYKEITGEHYSDVKDLKSYPEFVECLKIILENLEKSPSLLYLKRCFEKISN